MGIFRKQSNVAARMAWKLVLLSLFTLSVVDILGVIPDPKQATVRRRVSISESLAISSSLFAQQHQHELVKRNLAAVVERNPEIASACLRRNDGTILHQIGDHKANWYLKPDQTATPDNIFVPVTNQGRRWGRVELSFNRDAGIVYRFSSHPLVLIGLVTLGLNWIIFRWYLSRAFKYLDPSKSVPMHVRATLDTFSEGVVVLDTEQRIVLANDKFKSQMGKEEEELLGKGIDEIPWESDSDEYDKPDWAGDGPKSHGIRLGLTLNDEHRIYLVNSSAILGNKGERRGTIVSFDDITPLEENRKQLGVMLAELQSSRDELTDRNKELQHLATRDSLTGCLNRRTFFEIFDKEWKSSKRHQKSLSCFMVDVDHFKSVNDNHGHAVGDEVLKRVSATIQEIARESDTVCRYGGEEFCVLLPNSDVEQARMVAERLRIAIEALEFEQLSVTASLGVSDIAFGAPTLQEMLEQADKCLYAAKRGGRNQVVTWDNVPDELTVEEQASEEESADVESDSSIPYAAVTSLVSALAYRDPGTAMHSTRVAEFCVATASGLLSVKDTYVLEVAALLHDIGKIGVPDAILLKPGPLTREEWETMNLHDRIGVEIVEASFPNTQLVDIVKYHHAMFGGNLDAPYLPSGEDIPLGARIVTIADAYDAMTSDRVYRKGRPREEAFEELRRCAGRQFDPELVERFIEVVASHEPVQLPVDSRQSALQVGLQIERLAEAIDNRDNTSIKALAIRLEHTAAQGRIPEIESAAAEIKSCVSADIDEAALLRMVEQLMTLCRSAQKVHAETSFKQEAPTLTD